MTRPWPGVAFMISYYVLKYPGIDDMLYVLDLKK